MIHPLLAHRRSPRAFDPSPLDPDQIHALLEAARWAPSAGNLQPWRFLVAPIGDPSHAALLACLNPGNRRWAGAAPLLVLAGTVADFDDGTPNAHARHDLGLAVGQLIAQATALGLAAHPMAGFDPQAARAAFQVPAAIDLPLTLAVGRPGAPDTLPDDLRARELAPRVRRPLADTAFAGRWDQAWRRD